MQKEWQERNPLSQAYLVLIWKDLGSFCTHPGLLALPHSLTHSLTEHLLPSRPWRQHRSDALPLLIQSKLSLPSPSPQAWPVHGPAFTWSSGDVFAESGQSQPRQTLPSLCLFPVPPSFSYWHLPFSAWEQMVLPLWEQKWFVLLHSIGFP